MSDEPFDRTNIPLPVAHYQKTHAVSRTWLWRAEKNGLRILHVGGKRFIAARDWAAYLEAQAAKAKEVPHA